MRVTFSAPVGRAARPGSTARRDARRGPPLAGRHRARRDAERGRGAPRSSTGAASRWPRSTRGQPARGRAASRSFAAGREGERMNAHRPPDALLEGGPPLPARARADGALVRSSPRRSTSWSSAYSLGGRDARGARAVPYLPFIVPGLVFLGLANNAFLNTSSLAVHHEDSGDHRGPAGGAAGARRAAARLRRRRRWCAGWWWACSPGRWPLVFTGFQPRAPAGHARLPAAEPPTSSRCWGCSPRCGPRSSSRSTSSPPS